MRQLITSDLFTLSRILKKMGVRNAVASLAKDTSGMSKDEKAAAEQNLSVQIPLIFIENMGNAEKECYKFLASLTGKTPDEIEHPPAGNTLDMVNELFAQEGFGSFLSTAAKATQ